MEEILSILPKHKAGLSIEHDQHKNVYETIEIYIEMFDEEDWISLEDKQKCIDSDEIWEIQWYRDTPIGFFRVVGSSLELILKQARTVDEELHDE